MTVMSSKSSFFSTHEQRQIEIIENGKHTKTFTQANKPKQAEENSARSLPEKSKNYITFRRKRSGS